MFEKICDGVFVACIGLIATTFIGMSLILLHDGSVASYWFLDDGRAFTLSGSVTDALATWLVFACTSAGIIFGVYTLRMGHALILDPEDYLEAALQSLGTIRNVLTLFLLILAVPVLF